MSVAHYSLRTAVQMVTGQQIKAARLLLNWRQVDLADRARTTQRTIGNVELNADVGMYHRKC
jgi:transcriptional regulator with XRE-family HTH domain